MHEHATALADAVDEALPRWVVRCVEQRLVAWAGTADPAVMAAAAEAGARAGREIGSEVRELLLLDVDEQPTTPLALLRRAVRYPTEVLHQAGVPPVERNDWDLDAFPDDDYGLVPASFADIDPGLAGPGLAWGAAKAWEHKQRHGSEAR